MRAQRILKGFVIISMIVCIVFLAIDLFKTIKINFNYAQMQSTTRISTSSSAPQIRYEPTGYKITNKEDVLEQIKEITVELKNEQTVADTIGLFEIGNIQKIEPFFYEYEQYITVKYKLLNIVEDLPRLHRTIKGYTNEQLINYFNENSSYIEKYYGITASNEFVNLAKSLSFLGKNDISFAAVRTASIEFDYDSDMLLFIFRVDAGENSEIYSVKVEYYKSTDNQVKPYVTFKTVE